MGGGVDGCLLTGVLISLTSDSFVLVLGGVVLISILFSWRMYPEIKLEFMLFYTDGGSAPEITDRSCQWDPKAWWDVCLIRMPKKGVATRKKCHLFLFFFSIGKYSIAL